MAPRSPREPITTWVGRQIAEVRTSIRWTQRELASHVGLSQSVISDIEAGRQPGVSIRRLERLLDAMGARLLVTVDPPRVASARVHDPVHARCSEHVVRRLRRSGWEARTEAEVGGNRSRGWIDVLAFRRDSRCLLMLEIKTELLDIGQIERTMSWYEREAWTAAQRQGWRPASVTSVLLVLATEDAERVVRDFRVTFDDRFPGRANRLAVGIASGVTTGLPRSIALIDPRSRRIAWLRPLRIDGRRSRAPYRDYLDCLRLLNVG